MGMSRCRAPPPFFMISGNGKIDLHLFVIA